MKMTSDHQRALRMRASEARDAAFEEAIRAIPRGTVATYGQVAEAAGYPRYHRAVARFLTTLLHCEIPWQRVVGAGGEIKVRGKTAVTQRALLRGEGVTFTGRRVRISDHRYIFGD